MSDKKAMLLDQYKLLHEDMQASYRSAWKWSCVFVLTACVILLPTLNSPIFNSLSRCLVLAMALGVVWFWQGTMRALQNDDAVRHAALRKLERDIETECGVDLAFYRDLKSTKRSPPAIFSPSLAIALTLTGVIAIAMIAAMVPAGSPPRIHFEDVRFGR